MDSENIPGKILQVFGVLTFLVGLAFLVYIVSVLVSNTERQITVFNEMTLVLIFILSAILYIGGRILEMLHGFGKFFNAKKADTIEPDPENA